MKTRFETKAALLHAVAAKKKCTRERLEYAARTAALPPEEKAHGTPRCDALVALWSDCRTAKAAARAAQLAHAFARGRPYRAAERHTLHPPLAASVARAADAAEAAVEAWLALRPSDELAASERAAE